MLATTNKRNGLAILSFSLGLCGLVTYGLCGIGSIVGIVAGVIALIKVRTDPSGYGGRGFAIAGLATNAITLLLVMSVAIPNVFMSDMARNETSALSSLLSIGKAESELRSRFGHYGSLEELKAAGLLPSELAGGSTEGYVLAVVARGDSFDATVTPLRYRNGWWHFRGTGQRSFYINELGTVHEADKNGGNASSDDPPLD